MENTQHAENETERGLSPLEIGAMALLALALLLAPFWAGGFAHAFNAPAGTGANPWGVPAVIALAGVAALLTVASDAKRPVLLGAVAGLTPATLGMGVWALVTVAFSPVQFACWNVLLTLWAALLIAGLTARLSRCPKAWLAILGVLQGTASVVALMGVVEYAGNYSIDNAQHRIFSSLANPDFLAGYLLLAIPMGLAAFAATDNGRARGLFGIGIALQTAALLLTGSRAGALALAGGIAIWLILAAWSGRLTVRKKQIALAIGLCLLAGALASAPLRSRVVAKTGGAEGAGITSAVEAASTAQSHSGEFRKYTWQGTLAMARSNLLLGTGIGSYELAYPRYNRTAFTAHAHNGYLQWTAETGGAGAILFLAALAALAAFSLHALRLGSPKSAQEDEEPFETPIPLFAEPHLLLAGFLASLAASLFHGFFDSDWYIVAILTTLAALLGLALGLARSIAPHFTLEPRAIPKIGLGLFGVLGVILVWQGAALGVYRQSYEAGNAALEQRNADGAKNAYLAASQAMPREAEPLLQLALLEAQAFQRPQEAETLLKRATQIAPAGKTFYRLGQFYVRAGQWANAAQAFEAARDREPRNVQNLRALAESYLKAGQKSDSQATYALIAELERGVFGRVRAMPEMVETEFAYAHIGLGDFAFEASDWNEAAAQYQSAAAIFNEYWRNRTWGVYQNAPKPKREEWADRYAYALGRQIEALQKRNAPNDAPHRAKAEDELQTLRRQRAEDAAKEANAPQNATGGTP